MKSLELKTNNGVTETIISIDNTLPLKDFNINQKFLQSKQTKTISIRIDENSESTRIKINDVFIDEFNSELLIKFLTRKL